MKIQNHGKCAKLLRSNDRCRTLLQYRYDQFPVYPDGERSTDQYGSRNLRTAVYVHGI